MDSPIKRDRHGAPRLYVLPFKHGKETWEEQRAAGRYNPAPIARYVTRSTDGQRLGFRVTGGWGTRDAVYAYTDGEGRVYFVSVNSGLNYAGIVEYTNGEETGDVFAQIDHEVAEALGPRGVDLHPAAILRRLLNYLPDR